VNRRIIWDLFKYLLAFGLLGYVIWANWGTPGSNGLGDVWDRHVIHGKPINLSFLVLGLVLYAVSIVITLLRWYVLVRAQDLPFTVTGSIRLGVIGIFWNTFLPGSVGGDIIKATFLAREQSRRTVAVATVIMDRVLALWGLCWFVALLGGAFWACGWLEESAVGPAKVAVGPAKVTVLSAAGIVAVSVIVWLLMGLLSQEQAERFADRLGRIPKVGHSAAEFWRAVWMYRCRQKAVAFTLVVSWIGQAGFVLAFYCCARVLYDGSAPLPSLAQHFLLVPIGLVIMAVPLFPGGVGIGEKGFEGLYYLFAGPAAKPLGVLASLVQRVMSWLMALLGGLVYLRLKNSDRPAPALKASPTEPDESGKAPPEPVTSAGIA
jgi:uncharacterized membrane protein YbhN (UPF0104 family)